jgi:dipeptidyl aminopeptidase/acylaminoacyl peptidase
MLALTTTVARPLLGGVALAAMGLLAVNAAIRFWLRAPRVANGVDPSAFDLPFRSVGLPTVNGKNLRGWLVNAEGVDSKVPALVVMHGWGGNSAMMLPLAEPLVRAGYALLYVDARGHGASDGDTFASLPRFAEDLESAFDWLRRCPGIDPRRIALIGHSVGAAAALLVAARRGEVAAVVSLASFAHPQRMMRRYLAARRIPFVPFGWYVLAYVQRTIGHRFDDIAPENAVGRIGCAVLLAHGLDDTTVPVGDARLIHARSHTKNTHLLLVEGDHENHDGLKKRAGEVLAFLAGALSVEGEGG